MLWMPWRSSGPGTGAERAALRGIDSGAIRAPDWSFNCLVGSLQKAVLAAAIDKAPRLVASVEAGYGLDAFPRLHQLHWLRPSCPRACAILKVLCDHTAVC